FTIHSSRIGKVKNGIPRTAEWHALVNAGEKSGPPIGSAAAGSFRSRIQDDKAGQIFRFTSQTIERPCPNAGSAKLLGASAHHNLPRSMVEGVGGHPLHDGNVIRHG